MTGTDLAKVVPIDHEAVLKAIGLNPRDANTQALILVCDKYGLDPVLKHMVLIKGRPYITRDGLLHVAHASGRFDGIEVLDQGETDTHWTAKVAVYRKDMGRPFAYVGRYPKSGDNKTYGPEMAVKCAEVMAFRRAFDIALCAAEELWDEQASPAQTLELAARARALPDKAQAELKSAWRDAGLSPVSKLRIDELQRAEELIAGFEPEDRDVVLADDAIEDAEIVPDENDSHEDPNKGEPQDAGSAAASSDSDDAPAEGDAGDTAPADPSDGAHSHDVGGEASESVPTSEGREEPPAAPTAGDGAAGSRPPRQRKHQDPAKKLAADLHRRAAKVFESRDWPSKKTAAAVDALILNVTEGKTSSASDLTQREVGSVMQWLADVERGAVAVHVDDDGSVVLGIGDLDLEFVRDDEGHLVVKPESLEAVKANQQRRAS